MPHVNQGEVYKKRLREEDAQEMTFFKLNSEIEDEEEGNGGGKDGTEGGGW